MTAPGPCELVWRAGTPMSWSTCDLAALRAALGVGTGDHEDRVLDSMLKRKPLRCNPDAPGLLVAHYWANTAVILEGES